MRSADAPEDETRARAAAAAAAEVIIGGCARRAFPSAGGSTPPVPDGCLFSDIYFCCTRGLDVSTSRHRCAVAARAQMPADLGCKLIKGEQK